MEWLDKLDYSLIIMATLLLGFAPFFPEPHLVQKIRMLKNKELKRPIDIFDLFYHLIPFFVLGLKLIRDFTLKNS
jgi:hypothetical protein